MNTNLIAFEYYLYESFINCTNAIKFVAAVLDLKPRFQQRAIYIPSQLRSCWLYSYNNHFLFTHWQFYGVRVLL